MDRKGGLKRKWGNVESESLSIFSFSLHFLIISPFADSLSISSSFSNSPFSRSQAARLTQFVQPCRKLWLRICTLVDWQNSYNVQSWSTYDDYPMDMRWSESRNVMLQDSLIHFWNPRFHPVIFNCPRGVPSIPAWLTRWLKKSK